MLNSTIIIPLLLIYAITSYIIFRNKNISRIRYSIYLCLAIYLSAVTAVTIFPIPIDKRAIEDTIATGYNTGRYNLIPFKTIIGMASNSNFRITALKNIGGNILLLMPLGFGVPLIWNKYNHIKKSIVIGLLSTVSIELIQLLVSTLIGYQYRSFDVDDIILNLIGFIMGFIVYKLVYPLIHKLNINI